MKKILFLFALCTCNALAQNNEISIPSHTYMMEGYENQLFFQTFMKKWSPYNYFVRVSGAKNLEIHTDKKIMIKHPVQDEELQFNLIEGDNFETIQNQKTIVRVGQPGVGKDSVKVQFFGDSFTQGLFFKYAMLTSKFVPKVRLIGTIHVKDDEYHAHDGRGGWSVTRYFTNDVSNQYFYNPFWQPDGIYHYWGNTLFWKNCIYVKNSPSEIKEFGLKYWCSGYSLDAYAEDGRRRNPVKNDLMWDGDKKEYILWNGRKWISFDAADLKWDFNYEKYITMNKLDKPDFFVVMLGLNDFRNGKLNPDFTTWNSRMEKVYTEYKKVVPHGKFIVCTPSTSCGVLNNAQKDFTTRQNRVMWSVRKDIIDKFDNREDEDIYVVDASATLDNENGFNMRDGMQIGNPHPYPNYPALGMPIAAFIQYVRNK